MTNTKAQEKKSSQMEESTKVSTRMANFTNMGNIKILNKTQNTMANSSMVKKTAQVNLKLEEKPTLVNSIKTRNTATESSKVLMEVNTLDNTRTIKCMVTVPSFGEETTRPGKENGKMESKMVKEFLSQKLIKEQGYGKMETQLDIQMNEIKLLKENLERNF